MSDRQEMRDLGYVESFGGFAGNEDADDGGTGKRFYGKYRGTVLQNIDPERRGRLMVQVPDVLGPLISSWAMPCLPFAGPQMGTYIVPSVGSDVWIEFEGGDSDYPIWVGCSWGSLPESPTTAHLTTPGVPVIVMQTPAQSALVLCDVPVLPMMVGGVMIKSGVSSLTVDPTGVTITAPKITINGLTVVNNGALTVTL